MDFAKKGFIEEIFTPAFASLDDCGHLLSTEDTLVALNTAKVDLLHEALAIQQIISNVERLGECMRDNCWLISTV